MNLVGAVRSVGAGFLLAGLIWMGATQCAAQQKAVVIDGQERGPRV